MRPSSVVIVALALCCSSVRTRDQRAFAAVDEGVGPQQQGVTWLSERRAGRIVADGASIGDEIVRELAGLSDPNEAAIVEDVLDVLPHPSEWRWYQRDHGLLIALDVRKRLGITEASVGRDAIEAVAREVLERQGHGRPDVRVVFIEPAYPPVARGRSGSVGFGGLGTGSGSGLGGGAGGGAWGAGCGCW